MTVRARIAALDVEQIVVHGVTGAGRNGAHPVGAPAELIVLCTKNGVEQAAPVIHRRDRALETENVVAGLPVVADLTAPEHAGAVLAETLSR